MCTVLRPHASTTAYVHNLGDPIEPCKSGVPFRKRAWHLTPPLGPLWRKRHFRTPAVWMCTAPRPPMATTGYAHNLGGLTEPCTLGARFRKLAWHFTPLWEPLWCKRHFRAPSIRMCTATQLRVQCGCHRVCT